MIVEAAAATVDHEKAEALLREGLERLPGDRSLRAALARRLARVGRTDEAIALAEACVAEAPEEADGLGALRDSFAAAARWNDALRVAADEARLGTPRAARRPRHASPSAPKIRARASAAPRPLRIPSPPRGRGLGRGGPADADDDARSCATPSPRSPPGTPAKQTSCASAASRPDRAARDFLVRGPAPPPPAGQLAGLLTWTYDLFTTTPPLVGLAAAAGHAAEALDRPLLVAVMGEFNAGKSSFVNALCRRRRRARPASRRRPRR